MRKSRRHKNRIAQYRSDKRLRSRLTYENLEVRNLLAGDIYPGVTELVNLEEPVALADGMQFLRDRLELGENESMELVQIIEDDEGNQQFKYQQLYNGIRVEDKLYTLHAEGSQIVRLSGEFYDMQDPADESFLSRDAALDSALNHVDAQLYAWQHDGYTSRTGLDWTPEGELVYLPQADGEAMLTYQFDVFALEPFSRQYIYVDAVSGRIVQETSHDGQANAALTDESADESVLESDSVVDVNPADSSIAANFADELDAEERQRIIDHLAADAATSYLLDGRSDLEFVATAWKPETVTIMFQQTIDDIPVVDAYITVVQWKDGTIEGVYDRGQQAAPADNQPTFAQNPAEVAANESFVGFHPQVASTSELVWFPLDDSLTLAWQVDSFFDGITDDGAKPDFVTIVDANSGDLLKQNTPGTVIEDLLRVPETLTGVFPRIVINDTIGPQGSRDYAEPFDAVVAVLGLSGGLCSGVLVDGDTILTARHCNAAIGDLIVFGEDLFNPVFTTTVTAAVNPAGPGTLLDGGDLTIVDLGTVVPTNIAIPMRLTAETDSLETQVAATIGYGLNGVGSTGHEGTLDGFRWGGENIIDVYGTPASASGSNIISTDFDDGSSSNNTIPGGSSTPLMFEATTAGGDSGGPILVQFGTEWVVAGVLSGGTTNTSVYGDISWWTGVAPFQSEIEAAGGEFLGDLAILELESVSDGSLMYQAELSDTIATGKQDEILIGLDEDQKLSVLVHARYEWSPTVEVVDANDAVIATGMTYGSEAVVQLAPIDLAGEYRIRVGGQGDDAGFYDLKLLLNGQFELEGISGIDNGMMGSGEDIDGSSVELAIGVDRLGVVGELSVDETVVTASEDFEAGLFSSSWETSSSDVGGRVRILGDYGAAGGNLALVMDQARTGTNNLNEAIWTVDLAQSNDPILEFFHAEWNDETTPLPDVFNNRRNGDGVSVSADGTTWYTILTDTNTALGEWNRFTINLGEFADANNLTLGSDFKIKFQQYDDGPLTNDGRGYDEISIAGAGVVNDWYEFELPPGELASIAAEELSFGTGLGLALYDAGGNLLQESLIPSERQFINKFENTGQDSTFYLNLSGADTRYSLVVTRNADFETTTSESSPQSLDGIGGVLGSTSAVATAVAEPDSVANGVGISGSFEGVTLSNAPSGGPVYSVDVSYGAPTGESIFSPDPANFAGWREGVAEFRADFDVLQSRVSVDVGSDDGANDVSFLRAFDILGNLLAERISQSLAPGESQTLEIAVANPEIAYITAGGLGNDVAPVDNLVYEIASEATDYYSLFVEPGQQVSINASFPGDGPLLFGNGLVDESGGIQLRMELISPDGTTVATGTNSISHVSEMLGEFMVAVYTESGAGEYFVEVDVTGAPSDPFLLGDLNGGVAVTDSQTGSGYIMFSARSVFERFAGNPPNPDNSDHLIAVRHNGSSWQYNDDLQWHSFQIETGDRLLAAVDFENDAITSLRGVSDQINGMDRGYFAGDLVFMSNTWFGLPDMGEFEIVGSLFFADSGLERTPIGALGKGVAVTDSQTGGGFIMYSETSVFDRFAANPPNPSNNEHFVAVRFNNNQWEYNNNSVWTGFTPVSGDRLIASLNFSSDTVTPLLGQVGFYQGIAQGYLTGDLTFEGNRWGGEFNFGEFEITGSFFVAEQPVELGKLNNGVAVQDYATGQAYLMHSRSNVHSRFAGDPPHPNNSDNIIAVRYSGSSWQYNNNQGWIDFSPEVGDRLIAELDLTADEVTSLRGRSGSVRGIEIGFRSGDLSFQSNIWNGESNFGEFTVLGTYFTEPSQIGATRNGVAVADNATGTGYVMFSEANVHARFASQPPFRSNSDQLLAVRHNGSNWQYNNNQVWIDFAPTAGDRLIAALDFDNDTITSLEGATGSVNGIDQGFAESNLEFFANKWNGSFNDGEFQITGTYFKA